MPISQRIWSSSPESDAVIMRLCHFLNDASIHEGITLTPQSPLARRSSEGRAPNCSNTDIFSSIIKRLNQCTSQTCQSCAVAPELFFSQFVMAVQSIPEARQHGSCRSGLHAVQQISRVLQEPLMVRGRRHGLTMVLRIGNATWVMIIGQIAARTGRPRRAIVLYVDYYHTIRRHKNISDHIRNSSRSSDCSAKCRTEIALASDLVRCFVLGFRRAARRRDQRCNPRPRP